MSSVSVGRTFVFWLRKKRLKLRERLKWEFVSGILAVVLGLFLTIAFGFLNYTLIDVCLGVVAVLMLSWVWALEGEWHQKIILYLIVIFCFIVLTHYVREAKTREDEKALAATLEENSGTLIPADNSEPPDSACIRRNPNYEYVVFLGDATFVVDHFPYDLVRIDERNYISIAKSKDGGVALSVDVADESGKILASVEGNKFHVNVNNIFYKERPDKSTLVIVDQYKSTVLSIHLNSTRYMTVSGTLNYQGAFMLLADNSIRTGGVTYKGGCFVRGRDAAISLNSLEWLEQHKGNPPKIN